MFYCIVYSPRFFFKRTEDKSYNTFLFLFFYPVFVCDVLRTDSVSLSKEGELDSFLSHDILPSTCPDHPVVSSNAFHAADTHQAEGKAINHSGSDCNKKKH